MSEIVVTDEMVEAARAAFNKVRLREASPRRIVREWEAEAWRCAVEAAWNRRAPTVTQEQIVELLIRHLGVGFFVEPPYDRTKFSAGEHVTGVTDAADAILALLRGGAE